MGIIDNAKKWLFSIALKKGLLRVAQAAAAFVVGQASSPSVERALGGAGISVSVDPNALAAFLVGASEVARNWLKVKVPALGKFL